MEKKEENLSERFEANQQIANAIKECVNNLNTLTKKANKNNLVVELKSNELCLGIGKNTYEVNIFEKVKY